MEKPPLGKRKVLLTAEMIADNALTRQKLELLLSTSFYPDEPLDIKICLGTAEIVIQPKGDK